jgi:hypothetical protein
LTSDELMYVWRSFSKPSDRLLLSYSSSTVDGQSRSPSAAVARVRFLLPHLKTVAFSSELIAGAQSERYRTPTEDTVSRPVIRKLLGREIWLSQSRLQTFSRCPYSYYSSHILSLRERAEARFDNLNAGNFLHHVMEQYLKRALDGDNRIRPMDRQESQAIAHAIIDAYMIELCGDVRDKGRLLRFFDRLRRNRMQLFRLSWTGDYPDAENFLQLFYSGNAGSCNRANFFLPEFDRLYEKIIAMPDSPEREELCKKAAALVADNAAWIFEGFPVSYQLLNPWLENFLPHDFEFTRFKYLTVNPEKRLQKQKEFRPLNLSELR